MVVGQSQQTPPFEASEGVAPRPPGMTEFDYLSETDTPRHQGMTEFDYLMETDSSPPVAPMDIDAADDLGIRKPPSISDPGVRWDGSRQAYVHPDGVTFWRHTDAAGGYRDQGIASSLRAREEYEAQARDSIYPSYRTRTIEGGPRMVESDGTFQDPYRGLPGGDEFNTPDRPPETAGYMDDVAAADLDAIDPHVGYRPIGPDPSPARGEIGSAFRPLGGQVMYQSGVEFGPAQIEYEPVVDPDSGPSDPSWWELLGDQTGNLAGEAGEGIRGYYGRLGENLAQQGSYLGPPAGRALDDVGSFYGRMGSQLDDLTDPITDPAADAYRWYTKADQPQPESDDYYSQLAYSYVGMTGGFTLGNRNVQTIEEEADFRRDNADQINTAMGRLQALSNRDAAVAKLRELGPNARDSNNNLYRDVAAHWQQHADTTDLSGVSPEAAEYAQKLASQQGFRLPSIPTPLGDLTIPTPTNALNTIIEHQQSGDFRISKDEYATVPQQQYKDALDAALVAINLYSVPALTYRTAQGVIFRRLLTKDGIRDMASKLPRNLKEEVIEDGAIQIAYIPAGGGLQPGLLDLIELPTESTWEAAAEARGRKFSRLFVTTDNSGDPVGYELEGDTLQEVDLETFERTGGSIPVAGVSLVRDGNGNGTAQANGNGRTVLRERTFAVPDYTTVGDTSGLMVEERASLRQETDYSEVDELLSRPTTDAHPPHIPRASFRTAGFSHTRLPLIST